MLPFVAGWFGRNISTDDTEHDVKANRIWVGGLLVAILGGLVWKRGTGIAAAASMAVGSVITLGRQLRVAGQEQEATPEEVPAGR